MTEYQEKIWNLQQHIFNCPKIFREFNFSNFGGNCRGDIPQNAIKEGISPDAIFVGKNYGELKNFPRILFIGNNPNSTNTYFGPPHSIRSHFVINSFTEINAEEFYETYFRGVQNLLGFLDDDVMKNDQGFEQYWGIQPIIEFLYGHDEKFLNGISFTNGIFCKGPNDQGSPTPNMQINCIKRKGWLRKIIEILEPEIIFIFSKFIWDSFSKEWFLVNNEDEESYFEPDIEYAYKPQVVETFGYRSLVIRIPHLTRKWCNQFVNYNAVDNELKPIFEDFEFGSGAQSHRNKIDLVLRAINEVIQLNELNPDSI
ncbi:MAG: hypothetical protein ACTSRX_03340 [Promethearchaeota archaeon]